MSNEAAINNDNIIDLTGVVETTSPSLFNSSSSSPNKRTFHSETERESFGSEEEFILDSRRSRAMNRIMDRVMDQDAISEFLILTTCLAEEKNCLYQLPHDKHDSMYHAVGRALSTQLTQYGNRLPNTIRLSNDPQILREMVAKYVEKNPGDMDYNAYIGETAQRRADYCEDVRHNKKWGNIEVDLTAIAMTLEIKILVHKIDKFTGEYTKQAIGHEWFDQQISIAYLSKSYRYHVVEEIID